MAKSIWGFDLDEGESDFRPYLLTRAVVNEPEYVEYDLLNDGDELVLVYEYPVYYSRLDPSSLNAVTDVNKDYTVYNLFVFCGSRWAKLLLGVRTRREKSVDCDLCRCME